jgi:hypothetical protein
MSQSLMAELYMRSPTIDEGNNVPYMSSASAQRVQRNFEFQFSYALTSYQKEHLRSDGFQTPAGLQETGGQLPLQLLCKTSRVNHG